MDHGTFRQLAAGSVLDDLDAAERERFRSHRSGCSSCRRLTDELLEVTFDLALAAPARRPTSETWEGIRDAMRERAAEPRPAKEPRLAMSVAAGEIAVLRRETHRSRVFGLASLAAAAVLAVVAYGLTIRVAELTGDLNASRSATASARAAASATASVLAEQGAAMTVAVDPGHRTATLQAEPLAPSADAVVVYVPDTDRAYLMASHLPPTPAGMVYQLWVADAAGVHALGTFSYGGGGPFVAPLGVDLGHATATMVTLEPAGGAHGSPGPQVVFGEL